MPGISLALDAPRIIDPNTPEGYGEKALGSLGSAGGYFLTGRMPIVGSMLLSNATGEIGKRLGRGIDYLTGSKKRPRLVPVNYTEVGGKND